MATASSVNELVQRTEESSLANHKQIGFASIEDAVRDLKAGRMIIVIDDEDRENEGDLTMVADMITAEAINFMATRGRGLICLGMTGERLDHLELTPCERRSKSALFWRHLDGRLRLTAVAGCPGLQGAVP